MISNPLNLALALLVGTFCKNLFAQLCKVRKSNVFNDVRHSVTRQALHSFLCSDNAQPYCDERNKAKV